MNGEALGHFLDTSALAKYYHREVGTGVVEKLLDEPTSAIFISRLTAIEIQSVFARRVRAGELVREAFQLLRQRFFADIVERRLTVVRMTDEHYQAAQDLLLEHATESRLRTLDALQLAVAVDLRDVRLIDRFVCADVDLCAVAAREELVIVNPEVEPADSSIGPST